MTSEFNMTKLMADELLKARKNSEKKMDTQEYLCKVINEQFCLLYPCTKVTISL